MKFRMRCKLWGHKFMTKANFKLSYDGTIQFYEWKASPTCYHCGLTKEEAGIVVESNVPMS
jgi:hypothetical protein